MSGESIEEQLSRLESLLCPSRTRVTLEKTNPEHSPEELGALAGVGYLARNPDLRVSVYIFGDWGKHREVSKQLRSRFAGETGVYAQAVTNGPMLLFAHTRIDGPDGTAAKYRLDDIMSAFAGDE